MPEYLSPGVYIQDINSGPRPIEGVGTAMAAFVGFAPAGPENYPTLITSWTQYVETFGSLQTDGRRNPHMEHAYLSHSVYGYFLNGGGRCYVTRVVSPQAARPAAQPLQIPTAKTEAVPALKIVARGTPTQDIQIEIGPPVGDEPGEGAFTLRVRVDGEQPEVFENVSMAARGGRGVRETVNQGSKLIEIVELQATGAVADRLPKPGLYTLVAPQPLAVSSVQSADLMGSADERSGVAGMELAENATMLCCPDLVSAFERGWLDRDEVKAVQLAMIAHCEHMQDRIAILDPIPGLKPQEVLKA